MKLTYVVAVSLLLSGSGLAHAQEANTEAVPYGGRTILLMVPEDQLAITLSILGDGTVKYNDIHLWESGLSGSYVRTVPYEIRDGEQKQFCVVKEDVICFDFPKLKTSEPKTITYVNYNDKGENIYSGTARMMLMEERAPFPVTKKGSQ